MSDLDQMARNVAGLILAEADPLDDASHLAATEEQVAEAFVRGALWAMTRATHALAITHAATQSEPAPVRSAVLRCQSAIATTAERMRQEASARART